MKVTTIAAQSPQNLAVILAAVGLLNVIKVALATRFMTLRDASRSLMDFYHTTI
jgi:hypothetical protein